MNQFRNFAAVFLLAFFSTQSFPQIPSAPPDLQSAYAEKISIEGIPNTGKINDHLYRGAQPSLASLAALKKMGVTTVVNLRREDIRSISAERQQVEALGLHFVHLPVGGFSAPTNEQIIQFLSIFRDHPAETVFVHCHYGDDRTGVFVASYRMTFEHWPAAQAANEMNSFHFNRRWQHEMRGFVSDFPARLNTAPDLAEFQKTLTSITPTS
jgi:protein tyrosine/serine phosphatase